MIPWLAHPPLRRSAVQGARRRLLIAVGSTAVGTLLATKPAGLHAQSVGPSQRAARPAPDLPLPAVGSVLALPALPLLDGSTLEPDARRGKVAVVYWWASWCPFCAEQSPLMEALWRGHQDRGLLVVGLSIDRTAEIAAAHWRRKGFTFPSAWLSPGLTPRLAKPKGLPVTVVVGTDDKVLAAESGQMFDEDVAALAAFAAPRRRS